MKNSFTLFLPKDLEFLNEELTTYLNNKLKEITAFFDIKSLDTIRIFIYNNEEEYKKICKSPYPLSNLAGAFGHDNVRVYVNINKISKDKLFSCICHEIVHLLYQNYVQEKGIQNRVIWFDEGLAIYLSGEHDDLFDKDNLNKYLEEKIYIEEKTIPKISFLHNHGTKYGQFVDKETNKYSGYTWPYLMIRYLIETTNKEELQHIMRNREEIKKLEESIINDTYHYYNKKRVYN